MLQDLLASLFPHLVELTTAESIALILLLSVAVSVAAMSAYAFRSWRAQGQLSASQERFQSELARAQGQLRDMSTTSDRMLAANEQLEREARDAAAGQLVPKQIISALQERPSLITPDMVLTALNNVTEPPPVVGAAVQTLIDSKGYKELRRRLVDEYLERKDTGVGHHWRRSNVGSISNDTIIVERCKRCNLIHRYYPSGPRSNNQVRKEGFFLGGRRLAAPSACLDNNGNNQPVEFLNDDVPADNDYEDDE